MTLECDADLAEALVACADRFDELADTAELMGDDHTTQRLRQWAARERPAPVELTIFYGDGCPHCHAELEFLVELQERWPDLRIVAHEVWQDAGNRVLYREVAAAHGIEADAVPGTFLGGRAWIGYSDPIGAEIEATVAALYAGTEPAEPAPAALRPDLAASRRRARSPCL